MVLSKGFIETMDKHINKRTITTYTRIEPPIYPDTYPGKIISDCGSDLGTFDENLFNKMQKNGIILIDDYGEIEGATKAIDFFFKNKKYNIEKLNYYKRPSFIKI